MPTDKDLKPIKHRSKAFDREIRELSEEADAEFQRAARRTDRRMRQDAEQKALSGKFEPNQ